MPKGPHAILSSPFRQQSEDVRRHIVDNCRWILFHDGSAAEKRGSCWYVLVGAGDAGGEAEIFITEELSQCPH